MKSKGGMKMQATWLAKNLDSSKKPDADNKAMSFADRYDLRLKIAKNISNEVDTLVNDLTSDIIKIVLRNMDHMPDGR